MNNLIENLFQTNVVSEPQDEETEIKETSLAENEEARKRTYHETGFRDGSRNSGSPLALSICLNAIYAKFQNEEKELTEKQRQTKEPYLNEQKSKESEVKTLLIGKASKEEQINRTDLNVRSVKDTIEELKFEINDLARDPQKYHIEAGKGTSSKFWIGLIIILPISLYLFTFYISTSYSAFFKKFDLNTDIMTNVLDSKAFENAWRDGTLEGAFVTLIPFVFLGLGYLIHMFGENKSSINYLKIALLFITTFIFDAILAYQIEEKIYGLEKTFEAQPFNLAIAFQTIQFWGIIFAGFVVYLIWGVVFDFIMKEHRERDKIKHEQLRRRKNVQIHQERISDINIQKEKFLTELNELNQRIATEQGRIVELQRVIDAVIIPTKEYVLYASEYMQGWITFINQKLHLSQAEKTSLENQCISCYQENLKHVGASEDAQNSVYLSSL
ncbi:beta-carotene 15,15'-monooxygenase [Pedobacter endophyticus]|uniref:Beta-carotene 15,15'-monooxygenase n=1 Tax=Pedobacter endophyticus TaxID=2789740 RepID=A0A7U3Q3E8_9SPHI|nr:beta-carotene 15,15'-monooxygenase [Pedobacter endophyticus]QPH37845.1 beta-carotene 15,15'-monooxygenase [Pedobacter endophyticus]